MLEMLSTTQLKKQIIKVLLLFPIAAAICVGQPTPAPSNYPLYASVPPAVSQLTLSVIGNRGNSTYCYVVVANYTIGSVPPTQSTCISSAPDTLTNTNYVMISFGGVGALTYDILSVGNQSFPNSGGCTNCVLTTGTSSTTYNNTSTPSGNYTLVSISPAQMQMLLDNSDYPLPRFIFRGNQSTVFYVPTPFRVNFGDATSSKPAVIGSSLPATCEIGDIFFNKTSTAGSNLYLCTSANTWTQIVSSSGLVTLNGDVTGPSNNNQVVKLSALLAHNIPSSEGTSPMVGLSPNALGDCLLSNGLTSDASFQACLAQGLQSNTFAGLGIPPNGTGWYCSDCTVTSTSDNTCAGSGSGAIAFRIASVWRCYSVSNSGGVATFNSVTFNATPTFTVNGTGPQVFFITLTGNVTSSTISGGSAGQQLTFIICQDGSGGHTFVGPTNIFGLFTIGSTLSKCSSQSGVFGASATNLYMYGTGVINE